MPVPPCASWPALGSEGARRVRVAESASGAPWGSFGHCGERRQPARIGWRRGRERACPPGEHKSRFLLALSCFTSDFGPMKIAAVHGLAASLAPDDEEVRRMIEDLRQACGSIPKVAACLGVEERTVSRWVYNERPASILARRALWFFWSLRLRPSNLTTVWSITTWGRGGDPPRHRRRGRGRPGSERLGA